MEVPSYADEEFTPSIARLIGVAFQGGWKVFALLAAVQGIPTLLGIEQSILPVATMALIVALAPLLIFPSLGPRSKSGISAYLIAGAVVLLSAVFPIAVILFVGQKYYDPTDMAVLILFLAIPTNLLQAILIAMASRPILAKHIGRPVSMPSGWMSKVVALTAILTLLLTVIVLVVLVVLLAVPLHDRFAETLAALVGSIPGGFAISLAFVAVSRFEGSLWSGQ